MTTKSEQLKKFLMTYLGQLFEDGGSGKGPLPKAGFDLTARDYLRYAEREIGLSGIEHRICCVSNLKRAAECQVDTFLHTYNLLEIVKKRSLGFDKKLEFIESVGLFSSQSLIRFNTIRNKIEHDYKEPKISNLEVFLDLVHVLVSALESAHLLLLHAANIDFQILEAPEKFNTNIGVFSISYDRDATTVSVRWDIKNNVTELSAPLSKDLDDFKYFLKIYFLLFRREAFASDKYVLSEL